MLNNIHELSAADLQALYAKREISPVKVFEAIFEHINNINPILNCFSVFDPERALMDAKAAEKRWLQNKPLSPIDGIPTTIKDGFNAKGWPTVFGSKTVDPNQEWNEDAPVTSFLREAGAVLLGKTTMPELGWKGVTESPVTGLTRNPWDTSKTSGGSSGGAASGLASGMFPLAVGTDGGGSIRIPASFCGVFGVKPTQGLVPLTPPSLLGSFVHVGPMTRTVADAATLMNILAGYDARDCYSIPMPPQDYTAGLDNGVKGLKIAYSPNLKYYDVEPEVADSVAQAIEVFKGLGADVQEVHPDIPHFLNCFNLHWLVCMRHHYLLLDEKQQQLLEPNYVELAKMAEEIELYTYDMAQLERRLITVAMNQLFMDYDLLITPTEPCVAFNVGQDSPHPENGILDSWTPFTCLFNLTGHPAATIPSGFTKEGLPIGMQIASRHFNDKLVLQACRAYEQENPIVQPKLELIKKS